MLARNPRSNQSARLTKKLSASATPWRSASGSRVWVTALQTVSDRSWKTFGNAAPPSMLTLLSTERLCRMAALTDKQSPTKSVMDFRNVLGRRMKTGTDSRRMVVIGVTTRGRTSGYCSAHISIMGVQVVSMRAAPWVIRGLKGLLATASMVVVVATPVGIVKVSPDTKHRILYRNMQQGYRHMEWRLRRFSVFPCISPVLGGREEVNRRTGAKEVLGLGHRRKRWTGHGLTCTYVAALFFRYWWHDAGWAENAWGRPCWKAFGPTVRTFYFGPKGPLGQPSVTFCRMWLATILSRNVLMNSFSVGKDGGDIVHGNGGEGWLFLECPR